MAYGGVDQLLLDELLNSNNAGGVGGDAPPERVWNGSGSTSTFVPLTGDANIDGLIAGSRWVGDITYSTPDELADYQGSYFTTPHSDGSAWVTTGFSQFNAQQLTALHFALNTQGTASAGFSVTGFTNLTATYAGVNGSGTIRAANLDDALPTAYAYYPSSSMYGGDTFFSSNYDGTSNSYKTPIAGGYAWYTVLHEIGHSLGLKHGHESPSVPSGVNSGEYTVMTYHSYVGGTGYFNEQWGGPQTFMMLDIAALQYMYGADFTTNNGNTVYKWDPTSGNTYVNGAIAIQPGGNRIFATIWDGGGTDTYDLSSYTTSLTLDLRPGEYSVFSAVQLAYLGGGPNGGYSRGNIFNALLYNNDVRSLIENATGGSADDTITGNIAGNTLRGEGGNDKLYGGVGIDYLYGGVGYDIIDGGADDDHIYGEVGGDYLYGRDGNDRLYGGTSNDRLYGGTGYDILDGGAGDDLMYGEGAGDYLYGRDGNDTAYGGDGIDRMYGGNGYDILDGGAGDDQMYGEGAGDYLYGRDGNDTLYGGDGVDRMYGGNGYDILDGGAGDDQMYGEGAGDYLYGRDGNDTIYGGGGVDRMYGGNGYDLLDGGAGDDLMYGEGAGDYLYGRDGNDQLYGGGGNDTIYGGDGVDSAYFTGLRSQYTVVTVGNFTTVSHLGGSGADGSDRVYDVELLVFSDQTIMI